MVSKRIENVRRLVNTLIDRGVPFEVIFDQIFDDFVDVVVREKTHYTREQAAAEAEAFLRAAFEKANETYDA
jgi:hypothetical protein